MDKQMKKKIPVLVMRQALIHGGLECPECGEMIEPEAGSCPCGWVNPLMEEGLI